MNVYEDAPFRGIFFEFYLVLPNEGVGRRIGRGFLGTVFLNFKQFVLTSGLL